LRRFFCFITLLAISQVGNTQNITFPDPGHEGLNTKRLAEIDLKDGKSLDFGTWVQYRVLFNFSNIPGPGGSTFDKTEYYDFFRQRFRVASDIHFTDNNRKVKTGGYMQIEYRGGWGGSGPMVSDPRLSVPILNPFNRLQERGLRYGFVYLNNKDKFNLAVGILPLTDQVGRVLFDADWDFNVGGIVISGKSTKTSYRAAYVRLIDGVGASGIDTFSKDGNMFLGDFNYSVQDDINFGLHIYGLIIPDEFNLGLPKYELWPSFTFDVGINQLKLKLLFMLNSGKIGTTIHTGITAKAETDIKLGKTNLSLLGLFATGDEVGEIKNRFTSLHELVGTAGYWAYMHIFTPSGPSDVNDLGLDPGNGGAGLLTFQTKFDFPIKTDKLKGQLYAGYVGAARKRNETFFMGIEAGGMLTYSFSQFLNLELGAAYASIGDFYIVNADGLLECFSRIQFTW
jgi:hypothetical protein